MNSIRIMNEVLSEERQLMKWVGILQVGIFWVVIFRGDFSRGQFDGWEFSGWGFSRWGFSQNHNIVQYNIFQYFSKASNNINDKFVGCSRTSLNGSFRRMESQYYICICSVTSITLHHKYFLVNLAKSFYSVSCGFGHIY